MSHTDGDVPVLVFSQAIALTGAAQGSLADAGSGATTMSVLATIAIAATDVQRGVRSMRKWTPIDTSLTGDFRSPPILQARR
jgi:hypothetical protein